MSSLSREIYIANDGEKLSYQIHGEPGKRVLVLIHGFTGSSNYFVKNVATLSAKYRVVAVDLRGHGQSSKAKHGYHVARLAMDLKNFLDHLREKYGPECEFVGVGCSLGAAILWTYAELFRSTDFHAMVFVDQAPLQDYLPDGSWTPSQGNYGCHDAASLAYAQATLTLQPGKFYQGLVEGCLGYRHQPQPQDQKSHADIRADEAFFVLVSKMGDPQWFAKLLANHTSYDHRDTIATQIDCPCLVMAGQRSGSFPVAGILETARLINQRTPGLAKEVVMQSGHWMFYEEPEEWSKSVLEFCASAFSKELKHD